MMPVRENKIILAAKQRTTTTSSPQDRHHRGRTAPGRSRASRRLRSSFRRPNHQGTNAGDDREPRLSSAATPPRWWVHAREKEGQVPDSSQTPSRLTGKVWVATSRQSGHWTQLCQEATHFSVPLLLAEGSVRGHLRPCHCEKRLHLCSRRAGSGNQGTNIKTAACLTERMDNRRQLGVQQRYLWSR